MSDWARAAAHRLIIRLKDEGFRSAGFWIGEGDPPEVTAIATALRAARDEGIESLMEIVDEELKDLPELRRSIHEKATPGIQGVGATRNV